MECTRVLALLNKSETVANTFRFSVSPLFGRTKWSVLLFARSHLEEILKNHKRLLLEGNLEV